MKFYPIIVALSIMSLFSTCSDDTNPSSGEVKLTASDGAGDDLFGRAVSIDGDYAIVGAEFDDGMSGSAYIFHFDGTAWVEQQKLVASDKAAWTFFGSSVSIDGNYAIVGAEQYSTDQYTSGVGAAYIFNFDGSNWIEQQKLLASDGDKLNFFGNSVSLKGNNAIVCADVYNYDTGKAYIFHFNGTSWVEQQKLLALDEDMGDNFGKSVSTSGNYTIFGASGDDDNGDMSGSAYIFYFNSTDWVEQQKLLASDGAADDLFGHSVSISGNYAIVGAPGKQENVDDPGSAYIFHFDGSNWIEQQKLLASDGAANDRFGYSVSIDDNYAIVGAYNGDGNVSNTGSAYIFSFDGTNWVEQKKLLAYDGAEDDNFGSSVFTDGSHYIVGARGDDDKGENSGAAYIFH